MINLKEKKFGRWTIIGDVFKKAKSKSFVICKCDCGTIREVSVSALKSKASKSCGCLQKESTTKHGDHLTKLYALWRNIRHRCSCVTNKDYKNYGAKGIFVTPEWESYVKFKEWALMYGYKQGLTIERKNNNMGYSPSNCIFVSVAENNKNKSNSYWWHVRGKIFKSASDAGKFYGRGEHVIRRWCLGESMGKYSYSRHKNCYVIKKYEGKYGNN